MKKNLLKYLIMTALLLCIIAADSRTLYASGGDKITSGDYTYRRLSDKTAELLRYNNKETKVVEIPSKIDGLKVTVIGTYAFCRCNAEEVHIPEGILKIRKKAFYYCKNLKEIDLPDSVESIGSNAFYICRRVKTITLPKNLKTLKLNALRYLGGLQEIKMRGKGVKYSVEDGILYNRNKTKAIYCPRSRNRKVVLNSKVKEIRKYMFSCRFQIPEIRVPASVEKIGSRAFFKLGENLEKIVFYGTAKNMPAVDKEAFKSLGFLNADLKLYVPANQYQAYEKLLADEEIAKGTKVKLLKLAK